MALLWAMPRLCPDAANSVEMLSCVVKPLTFQQLWVVTEGGTLKHETCLRAIARG